MCLSCMAKVETVIQQFLPHYSLVRATVDAPGFKAGQFGLVMADGPTFIFDSKELIEDPYQDDPEDDDPVWDDEVLYDQMHQHIEYVDRMEEELKGDPLDGWRLVNDCIAVSYVIEDSGRLACWLTNRIVRMLAEVREKSEEYADTSGKSMECVKCGRNSETVERRRQNTKYAQEERNWVVACEECFKEIEEYWAEMWEDYYCDRL